MSPNGKLGFGSVPGGDEVRLIDLRGKTASTITTVALDATPGIGNDQPDNMAVRGNVLYASLRASGKLAIVRVKQRRVEYVDLSPPAPFNPATCGPAPGHPRSGCAVHGVAVRP